MARSFSSAIYPFPMIENVAECRFHSFELPSFMFGFDEICTVLCTFFSFDSFCKFN